MGSLTSRPELPERPQEIVYVSVPSTTSSSSSSSSAGTDTGATENPDTSVDTSTEDTDSDESRVASLLRRNRGVQGTVRTGFTGVLAASDLGPQRKTLLGE